MSKDQSLASRRALLSEWLIAAYERHTFPLSREQSRISFRIGIRTFTTTASQAEAALAATYDELYQSFADRPTWGADERRLPSKLAVYGLANRRLASRLTDQLRLVSKGQVVVGLNEELSSQVETPLTHADSGIASLEAYMVLKNLLRDESPTTREVVLRRVAGDRAPAIAAAVGIEPEAVRQRLSRFRARARSSLAA